MSHLFEKPFTFDRVARILFSLLIASGIIYLIAILRSALLPFLLAWVFAYLMHPIVKFFQYRVGFRNRVLSIIALLLSLAIICTLVGMVVVPQMIDETTRAIQLIQNYNITNEHIPFIPDTWLEFIRTHINMDEYAEMFSKDHLLDTIKMFAPRLWTILSGTFSILFSLGIVFLILLYFIFILLDYEKITTNWINLIPLRFRPFLKDMTNDVRYSMHRYFRGQSLVALIVGILVSIGFWIVDFPLGISLGIFIGILSLIPYLKVISFAPIILLSMIRATEPGGNFWLTFGSAVIVLVIVQCIEDLFIVPNIMGRAMGLNPAIILLSLSIWGTLLGFVGLIVALPLTTLCLSYYRRFILEEIDEPQEKEP
ncbi:AI-2E family transporter [Parabacteroides sp. Marseille-P3160]|uniref:AI-2E family transporter n=1 Tax=Parabacteroides sp. Marseille-P3160 TaxID=1917887 RepID=UPI0009BC2FFE|nr:AI-2E family transporter [Parabacteroides sp. Marseille-P3160]